MTIWIVRKHPRHPYRDFRFLEAFTIDSTHASRKEAMLVADKKNRALLRSRLYSVGRVSLPTKATGEAA